MDASKSVGLTGAPQPGSVSQAVLVGELCGRKFTEMCFAGMTTFPEQGSIFSHGQLLDLDCAELEQNSSKTRGYYQGQGELPDPDCFQSGSRVSHFTMCVPLTHCFTA